MALVTDKEYYMERRLKEKCDLFIERREKNFDHLILIDGEEGYGKSTFSFGLAYYLAYRTNTNFTVNNIFFDPDELMAFASKTEAQTILWDEAALGALGAEWQSKLQKKLIKCLMVARKKRHNWIFLLPYLNEFKLYFLRRAVGIIHVYSPNDLDRGKFVYFNKSAKRRLIIQIKQRKELSYKKYTFRGKFTDTSYLIDIKKYDKKKDDTIFKVFGDEHESVNKWKRKYMIERNRLSNYCEIIKQRYGLSFSESGKLLGKTHMYITRGFEFANKYPELFYKTANMPGNKSRTPNTNKDIN